MKKVSRRICGHKKEEMIPKCEEPLFEEPSHTYYSTNSVGVNVIKEGGTDERCVVREAVQGKSSMLNYRR
jgi:hypothetical protein